MVQIGYTMCGCLPRCWVSEHCILLLQLATLFQRLVQSIVNVYLSIIWLSKPLAMSG